MTYWDGQKNILRLSKRTNSTQLTETLLLSQKLDLLLLPISN